MRISALEQTARLQALPRLLFLGDPPPGEPGLAGYRIVDDPEAPFDAIVVGDGGSGEEASAAAALRPLAPVAAIAGSPVARAELRLGAPGLSTATALLAEVAVIVRRVAALPEAVRVSGDPALLLLARCATRSDGLAASHDPAVPACVSYPTAGPIADVRRQAEHLAGAGLLARSFFDRLHVCPTCRSSRLSVREECLACRSPGIAEEATVHHFGCAHMALERAFHSGDGMVCPKCRTRLRHFGIDYEKPGVATVCNGCGHVDGEPAIGFLCLDCGAHHDTRAVPLRDWFSYTLTPAGEVALARGGAPSPALPAPSAQMQALHLLLRQGLSAGRGRPMAVVAVTFVRSAVITAEHGRRFAARTQALAVEMLRGALREIDFAADNGDGLLVYMPDTEPEVGLARVECTLRRVRAVVAADLGPTAAVVDPAAIVGDAAGRP